MGGLIVLGVIILFIFIALGQQNDSSMKDKQSEIIKENTNSIAKIINDNEIVAQHKFAPLDKTNVLILDKDNNIHLIYKKGSNWDGHFEYRYAKYKPDQIIKSEIVIDNNTVHSTDRTSQLAGMAVGGIALGSVGMVIGGLSGKTNVNDYIKSIDLKLTFDDLSNPNYMINFLTNKTGKTGDIIKKGYEKDGARVKNSIQDIEKWQGIMEVLMNRQNNKLVD